MAKFSGFIDTHGTNLLFALVVLVVLMAIIQWACWIAGWGRFARPAAVEGAAAPGRPPGAERPIRFVFADLFARLVDDFRHLLALVVMMVFLVAIAYALWISNNDIRNLNAALQAVTGSLSGIIGVIIGYYFGESSGRGPAQPPDAIRPGGPPVQAPPPADGGPDALVSGEPIQPAPQPAPLPPDGADGQAGDPGR